jgi:glycosyltransferase involved in cell wall biosynthesis
MRRFCAQLGGWLFMKPTVLHYTGSARDGGGIHAVVRALAATGGFRCILGVHPALEQRHAPHLHLWRGPALKADRIDLLNALRALAVAWRVRRWLRRGRRRIFHGHSRAGLLVVMWLRLLGARRVVATVHVLGRQRWFYRLAARWLKGRIYWLGPAMMAHYRIGGRDWSACLPDCLPPAARRPLKTRCPGRPPVFGCAGALVPVKNWELVVRAVATVPPEVPVRVVHAGGEDGTPASAACAARLRREAEESGAAGRIEWRGVVADMGAFFDEIDCLIVPSRWEASSVAALEAIAAGVPVLASAASGTRDLVERCQGGWLFPADSAEALGQRMMALSRGADLSAWRRNDAALDEFTTPRSAEAHSAVYRSLLES